MNGLAGLYGVLVAFMLAGAWDRLDGLRNTLAAEFTALADLEFISSLMPPPIRAEIAAEVDKYRNQLREELSVRPGTRETSTAAPVDTQMVKAIISFQPQTPGETQLQRIALDLIRELGDQRRIRSNSDEPLPLVVWFILIGGSIAVLGVIAVITRNPLGWLFLACFGVVIGLSLFSIYALSHPARLGLLAAPL